MKKIIFSFVSFLGVGIVSCSLNPAWILNSSSPSNWDPGRGIRPNTPEHRAYYFDWYSRLVEREAAGEDLDWQIVWKGIFDALNQGNVNAKLYQSFIIQERRKRELPALKYL